MRRSFLLPSLSALTLLVCACADPGAPGSASITQGALSADLHAISADSMRGRLVGTPEDAAAGDWILARFTSLGLAPAGDDGYVQRFDMNWFSLGAANNLTIAGAGGARAPGKDWTPANFAASATASGSVVYAGYGIVEPYLKWDDYQGQDVRGKVVMVLDGDPGAADPASVFDGVVGSEPGRSWRKAVAASKNGAAAILIVRRNVDSTPDAWTRLNAEAWPMKPRRVETILLAEWTKDITIPAAEISVE